jgi:hypothetical protein
MIYIVNVSELARVNREYWCCEYVITYIGSADCPASDCELRIGETNG